MSATMIVACASGVSLDPEDSSEEDIAAISLPLSAPFAARVVASGSGCPSGAWDSDVSTDGLAFTTTLSRYEITLDPGVTKAEKNCNLTITFNAITDVQYSVGDFAYSGYTYLEPNVKARLVTSNKFSSSSQRTKQHSELKGSKDQSFVQQERIGLPSGQWTKCGKKEVIQLDTKLTMTQPSGSKSTGYINLSSIDGEFTVRSRACTP